jgi:hypothetical protein
LTGLPVSGKGVFGNPFEQTKEQSLQRFSHKSQPLYAVEGAKMLIPQKLCNFSKPRGF